MDFKDKLFLIRALKLIIHYLKNKGSSQNWFLVEYFLLWKNS